MTDSKENRMNNKFISGLLTGIISSMCVVCAVVFINQMVINPSTRRTATEAAQTTSKNVEDTVSSRKEEIENKIDVLARYIDNYYLDDINTEQLIDGIYQGFMAGLGDPYSGYYTKEDYKSLQETTSGIYCGIGATVSQSYETGIITIVKPFEGGPANKAGILPGEVLYKVDGKEVTGEDLQEVVTEMKGEKGTKVTLEVVRDGEKEPLSFEVTRAEVEVPSIEYKMLKDSIGYIAVSAFEDNTDEQFREALKELEEKEMKGLVIDLRDNGGGLVETVVDMLDRILPEGMIVYTRDKNDKGMEYKSTDKEQLKIPLAVIINGNSASASEIFAGAVQDYDIGTLVGTTSFGKGIVQNVIPMSDGTALKLTIAKYYTPNGRNIHKKGIEPDVEVELNDDAKKMVTIPLEKDNQLQKAIDVVKSKIK